MIRKSWRDTYNSHIRDSARNMRQNGTAYTVIAKSLGVGSPATIRRWCINSESTLCENLRRRGRNPVIDEEIKATIVNFASECRKKRVCVTARRVQDHLKSATRKSCLNSVFQIF